MGDGGGISSNARSRASPAQDNGSGGISSLEDIQHLKNVSDCGIDSVIIGTSLYEGRFTLKEALMV